ncbi:hypothetical protein DUNSADRAFT_2621 [Dunaliella salina]|uniref:Encoded protein n=1 Tax=Dunaliella salina TaxID=3046 RepID=A0ABQ7GVB4_DUNSA|nr:hypothetical protein DUNSADRAFT_2621 [Dunaliella salina]|eukprot:KAF5838561.1 hypothetical protein DUNSADRAFT_2621 [Dunaliella salina]
MAVCFRTFGKDAGVSYLVCLFTHPSLNLAMLRDSAVVTAISRIRPPRPLASIRGTSNYLDMRSTLSPLRSGPSLCPPCMQGCPGSVHQVCISMCEVCQIAPVLVMQLGPQPNPWCAD